jgi:hypothetical protein
MTPEQIYARLDGMIGFQTGSADGGSIQGSQTVCDWVMLVKALLKTSAFRYLDDLEFMLADDVDASSTVVDTTATHFIGALIEMVSTIATDASGWIFFADADSDTVAGDTALNDDMFVVIHVVNVLTTGVSQFYPVLSWAGAAGTAGTDTYEASGIALNTGLCVGGDGIANGAFATDACRAWVLYRT